MPIPGREPSNVAIREAMDGALRELATGEGDLCERVVLASRILLDGVSLHDFPEREERVLFSRLQLGLMEMAWLSLPGSGGRRWGRRGRRSSDGERPRRPARNGRGAGDPRNGGSLGAQGTPAQPLIPDLLATRESRGTALPGHVAARSLLRGQAGKSHPRPERRPPAAVLKNVRGHPTRPACTVLVGARRVPASKGPSRTESGAGPGWGSCSSLAPRASLHVRASASPPVLRGARNRPRARCCNDALATWPRAGCSRLAVLGGVPGWTWDREQGSRSTGPIPSRPASVSPIRGVA